MVVLKQTVLWSLFAFGIWIVIFGLYCLYNIVTDDHVSNGCYTQNTSSFKGKVDVYVDVDWLSDRMLVSGLDPKDAMEMIASSNDCVASK